MRMRSNAAMQYGFLALLFLACAGASSLIGSWDITVMALLCGGGFAVAAGRA